MEYKQRTEIQPLYLEKTPLNYLKSAKFYTTEATKSFFSQLMNFFELERETRRYYLPPILKQFHILGVPWHVPAANGVTALELLLARGYDLQFATVLEDWLCDTFSLPEITAVLNRIDGKTKTSFRVGDGESENVEKNGSEPCSSNSNVKCNDLCSLQEELHNFIEQYCQTSATEKEKKILSMRICGNPEGAWKITSYLKELRLPTPTVADVCDWLLVRDVEHSVEYAKSVAKATDHSLSDVIALLGKYNYDSLTSMLHIFSKEEAMTIFENYGRHPLLAQRFQCSRFTTAMKRTWEAIEARVAKDKTGVKGMWRKIVGKDKECESTTFNQLRKMLYKYMVLECPMSAKNLDEFCKMVS
tara:strand:+ start:74 stop:1150 length:1077 start_codon:yes stop_codon:yes gene_type:complete